MYLYGKPRDHGERDGVAGGGDGEREPQRDGGGSEAALARLLHRPELGLRYRRPGQRVGSDHTIAQGQGERKGPWRTVESVRGTCDTFVLQF